MPRTAVLQFAFRPFFLLVGIFGALIVPIWIAMLGGAVPLPMPWPPTIWHAHEMIYGLVPAAIAGFLLTAVCTWTQTAPTRGPMLAGLVLLWLTARLALLTPGSWPPWLPAVLDLAFLPLVMLDVLRRVVPKRQARQYPIAVVLLLLTVGNAMVHHGVITGDIVWMRRGLLLGLDLLTALLVIVGGRITPAFTRNWLRGQDSAAELADPRPLAIAVPVLLALLVAFEAVGLPLIAGCAALVAAVAILVRLARWRTLDIRDEPLLWILHLGHLWLVLGLALRGLYLVGAPIPDSAGLHAIGTGAIGTFLLGVMSRVAMGHTGRELRVLSGGVVMYGAVILAGLLRVVAGFGVGSGWRLLEISGLLWTLAFAWFAVRYAPVLWRPRPDGRPG